MQIMASELSDKLLAVTALSLTAIRMNELVYRNVKHGNEFDKNSKTWVLTLVLDIHNSPGSTSQKLRNIFLRPAPFFSGLPDCLTQPVKIKPSFVIFHILSPYVILHFLYQYVNVIVFHV